MKRILFLIPFLLFFSYLMHPNIASANHVDTGDDQLIIINKSLNKLAFYDHGVLVKTFPVATGSNSSLTPEGKFEIIKLVRNMPYYKTNIPGGDPNNPLGDRWIGLNVPGTGGFTYGIHGTNMEWTIGSYASSGCVRMYNEEVRWLYDKLFYGATVVILRSDLGFDEIAALNGYTVEKTISINKEINLLHDTKAFNESHFYSPFNLIKKGKYQVLKKKGDWLYVTFDNKFRWIYTVNYANTDLSSVEKTIFLNPEEMLYYYPNENSPAIGKKISGSFSSFEESSDGWYHIQTSEYGNVWIKPSNVEELKLDNMIDNPKKESVSKVGLWQKVSSFFNSFISMIKNLFS